ncbi:MAG: type VI secretion system protein TssA [Pseudomonadota bacterium]
MNPEFLLDPISDASPCGEDLSFSPEFDVIIELQREDDATLDQGEWITALKAADWPGVQTQCAELLAHRSKDLRLMVWWAEARAMNDGYSGLQEGLEVCIVLCQRYWDHLHPLPDGADQEERSGNIGWFLNRIVTLASVCPVTQGRSGSHNLQQLQRAKALQGHPDRAAQAGDDTITLDKFTKALKDTPREFLKATLTTLEACLAALSRWQTLIDVKLGAAGPSFVPAREALDQAYHEVQRLAREVGIVQGDKPVATLADSPVPDGTTTSDHPTPQRLGPLRTPEQAFAQLREVAAFFRETQPHSPVAYLAEKAALWGEMPLHEWLRAVIKDGGTLAGLEETLGIKPPNVG